MYIVTQKDIDNRLEAIMKEIHDLINLGVLTLEQTIEVDNLRTYYWETTLDI